MSVTDAWSAIEEVVPRDQFVDALAVIAAVVPTDDGDDDAEWRRELVARYSTVRGFIELLVDAVDFGAVEAWAEAAAVLKQLPALIGRKKVDAAEVARDLVTGSCRRLVFADPVNRLGAVDKAAHTFCVLERLQRRRDGYACGADRWGDRAEAVNSPAELRPLHGRGVATPCGGRRGPDWRTPVQAPSDGRAGGAQAHLPAGWFRVTRSVSVVVVSIQSTRLPVSAAASDC
ncbi:hypothetical protein OG894_00415 [Streptomyces sp. NBC_01724]|uniref:hypothetical protein n=1 Tax=unclassified Streptomyces TaxID=2593676 RepID=UPI002E315171|nr:hypothetical protein [Streptomyces sp. NBC_01724]WTE56668.1 hypothetical protein OG987_42130 [Streptomyces sp. NBC_01620]WTE57371.1 hypothetical protein OG784_00390 [Streptomyces sp. NBC_01617]WTI84890.1 hypothetical protein OHB17_00795 [Streptomyces sp. NBC_00724]WTE64757.1 hypothetical protein OG784_41955 [Streptomyces sp. NBC_01617]WTI92036.1 hypothetical protein OHB17_41210 [Streptomyces sp. NBC_00724]